MTCTSGVFISDIKVSPSPADANSVFVACTSQQWDASILQPSKPCSMTSSVLVLFLFLSFFVFMSQLWKRARAHTDAVLSVSCIFKLFIFYRYCFSLSYAVTVVGLFIMTRLHHKSCCFQVVPHRLSLFHTRAVCLLCMWLIDGCSERFFFQS